MIKMDDAEYKKTIGRTIYTIELEKNNDPELDPVFELIRKRGGRIIEDEVDPRNRTADMAFNSKDPDFVPVVVELGLGELLLELANKVYNE